MTRLIDADALSEKLCKTTIFIKGGEIFQRLINDAPTIELDGDLISRQDAVNEIHKYFVEEIEKTPTEIDEDGDELYADMPTVNSLLACNKELSKRIKSLPSAQTEKPKSIMCKDCKYYKAKQSGKPWNNSRRYCNRSVTLATNPDDFCSYGERTEK